MPQRKGLAPSNKFEDLQLPRGTVMGEDYVFEPTLASGHKPYRDESLIGPKQKPIKYQESHHPEDIEEGFIEKMIKKYADNGNFNGADYIYLEQYLHPERDIIPKQNLRPTIGSVPEGMEVRRVPDMYSEFRDRPPSANIGGLGFSTGSRGKDYDSRYDTWDFDTNTDLFWGKNGSFGGGDTIQALKNYGAKKILQNVGTPFAVYERYPQDATSSQFPEPIPLNPELGKYNEWDFDKGTWKAKK